jgi:hypothetical protein
VVKYAVGSAVLSRWPEVCHHRLVPAATTAAASEDKPRLRSSQYVVLPRFHCFNCIARRRWRIHWSRDLKIPGVAARRKVLEPVLALRIALDRDVDVVRSRGDQSVRTGTPQFDGDPWQGRFARILYAVSVVIVEHDAMNLRAFRHQAVVRPVEHPPRRDGFLRVAAKSKKDATSRRPGPWVRRARPRKEEKGLFGPAWGISETPSDSGKHCVRAGGSPR